MYSVLDFFKIGIGPSSSHTIGPITASRKFVSFLKHKKVFGEDMKSIYKETRFGGLPINVTEC
jgi:hypothetical protein